MVDLPLSLPSSIPSGAPSGELKKYAPPSFTDVMDALFQLSSSKGPAPSLAAVDFAQAAIASGRFRLTA